MSSPPVPRALPPAAPLSDVAAWTAYLAQADIPVLAASADALERLRSQEDAREGSVDANRLGEALARDPLMTLRVLAHMARHRPPRRATDPQTVTAAAVLLGVPPFFRVFGAPPVAEECLAGRPEALAGFGAALRRATRAANLALAFAAHRGDADAALIHQAALLHDHAVLLLWCLVPDRAPALCGADGDAAPAAEAGAAADERLAALQWSLAEAWRLPPLLRRPLRPRDALLPRSRCVDLAVRLARGEAVAGLLEEAAGLLALPPDDVRRLIAETETETETETEGGAAPAS